MAGSPNNIEKKTSIFLNNCVIWIVETEAS